MHRTTLMLPETLKQKASRWAKRHGLSLGELMRISLEEKLSAKDPTRGRDSLFSDREVFRGDTPSDLSVRDDDFLYVKDKGKSASPIAFPSP